ncbi:MAG: EMC3/TMCO1 family protein [Candidatus Thorarchaeota archaeon]
MLLIIFQDYPLGWFSYPPGAMFFVLLLATVTALLSTGLTKWLTDIDEMNRKQKALKAHNEEKSKIIELAETDVERYRKLRKRWERKDSMFKQTQQRMSLQRIKPTCITFLPMIIIFTIVNFVFRPDNIPIPVALSPMNANDIPFIGGIIAAFTGGPPAPDWTLAFYNMYKIIQPYHGWINFTAWYFLCSFGMNTIIQRIFKLQTQASGGFEQMMGGGKSKALEFPDV